MADRTRTSICNMAADFLDGSLIGNINDNFGDAEIYARNYEEAVETVISEFSWNCGTSRARISQISTDLQLDATDYQKAYAYPSDCLSPIDINGRPVEEIHWSVETIPNLDAHGNVLNRRRVLWCDADSSSIILRYQAFIEPRDMTPHLAKACAIELAIRCCGKITNSTTKMAELRDAYAEATRGTTKRVGGHQVDTRQNRPKPRVTLPSAGQVARFGGGL